MQLEDFISLYRGTGKNIKTLRSIYIQPDGWKSYSYPLNYKVFVNDKIIKSLRWKYLVTTIFTESRRKNAIEFFLDTSDYDISLFARKTRNRINKSLTNCSFRRPELEDLLSFGLYINRQTLERQHRKDTALSDRKRWNKYITTLYSDNEIIILGAYYKERMVGYLIVFELEGVFNVLNAFIDREDSETTSPMIGLIYTLANQLIAKYGSVKISYGLDPFDPDHELSRFKRNMLFKEIPVTRIYIINPLLLFIFKLIIFFNITLSGRKNTRNSLTRKIVKLYQGHRIYYRSDYRGNHK